MTLRIRLVSDPVCPWCYIATAYLNRALELRPNVEAKVEYLPYRLFPELPPEGMTKEAYFISRFGAVDNPEVRRIFTTGKSAGIDFRFDRMERIPTSMVALTALDIAAEAKVPGLQSALALRLFEANFEDGEDIGDIEAVAELMLDLDEHPDWLNEDAALHHLRDPSRQLKVANAAQTKAHLRGVPQLRVGTSQPLMGAQHTEALLQLIDAEATR